MATHCSHCNFNNPPGMRFCGNCGKPVGSATPPANRPAVIPTDDLGVLMGADLMQRMQRAGLESAGQRRNVTILFADLTGYTALSEQIDNEDLYSLVQSYILALSNNVYKYEGIVDKLTGDGLMALFGAPITHENNAERGVRAALDMQADIQELSRQLHTKIGQGISMRIGLHYGPVIVGGVGTSMMMDYTAIGDTVNLAHRIEEAATPGTVLVSDAVYRQVRMLFDCQQFSVLNPKGIAHPVATYQVTGVKSMPGLARGIEGLRAPMIGRDHELFLLRKAVNSLMAFQGAQVVFVTGEAGLGKSRLTAEFKASLPGDGPLVLEGQSLAYRRSISYWIWMDLLYSYLGLPHNAPALELQERLRQKVYKILGSEAEDVLTYLEHMLSLPYSNPVAAERLRYLDASQLRRQIFLAMRDLLLVEAYQRPLLLILEDLHWADEASLEMLNFLIESLTNVPIFILGISRNILPGPLEKAVSSARLHHASGFQHIELQNLSINQSEQLLYQLLTIPELPVELQEQILQRAAGIPFYLEEILRMLIDDNAIQYANQHWQLVPGKDLSTMGVPNTLQELILARFDRLDKEQRRILQVASVIGKDFSLQVLQVVMSEADDARLKQQLGSLVERDFILPASTGSALEYTFRHILMSDAIYGTILRKERSQIHGQVGDILESLYADRLESQIELLANHYRWSPKLDRALYYLILAGQRAARNNINEQARQHFEAAQELLPKVTHTPEQAIDIYMGLGDALVISGDYPAGRERYLVAQSLAASHKGSNPAETRCSLYRKIARTYERQGEYDQALANLDLALETLDFAHQPSPVEHAQAWNDIGWIHFRRGSIPEAHNHLQKALELVEATDAYDVIGSVYNRLAGIAYSQGDWEWATSFLRKSIAIREAIHDLSGLASSFNNLGLMEIEIGAFDNALEHLTRSFELNTRLGQSEGIAAALNNLGWLRAVRGEFDAARTGLDQALHLARQIGYAVLIRQILKNIGELHLAAQEWEEAKKAFNEIIAPLRELGQTNQLADIYRLLGEAALGSQDLELANQCDQQAEEAIRAMESTGHELPAVARGELYRFRAMLAVRTADWEAASQCLREGEAVFQKLKSRLYLGRIIHQAGALAEARQDKRTAQLRYREAALLFGSLGAHLEEARANQAYEHLRIAA